MSDAQLTDLQEYLAVRREALSNAVYQAREQNLAAHSARSLGSGAAMKEGASKLEDCVRAHISEVSGEAQNWVGVHLAKELVRKTISAHLYAVVEDFMTFENAYRVGTRSSRDDAATAIEGRLATARRQLASDIRRFEVGASTARGQGGLIQTINAHTIIGPLQQSGGNAAQHNTINVSKLDVTAAIAALLQAIDNDKIRAEIGPDVSTIEAQLKKEVPSPAILSEAGRSIRTIIEGGVGGALGSALSPSLASALALFSAAIGIG